MGTGRDDFTLDTIRRAAGRVGYRCSFPGCPNATVGASMENARKVSMTGVAAHICAAAKGGPRYDENMTPDKRRGIENCIWLCQTHAKLIDTDEKTYPADLLRQWKAVAEERASKALANGDYFAEYYKSNGDNLCALSQLFDDLISSGQFDQLRALLEQYKTTLSEQYEEFVLRYKIMYDTYCCREKLAAHLAAYCDLPCKAGADMLAEFFLSFRMTGELKAVVDYCTDQLIKEYASMAISDTLMECLIVPLGSTSRISPPAEISNTIAKYIANHIRENDIVGAVYVTGEAYSLYSNEFYYHAISSAYELARMTIYGNDDFDAIIASPDFVFIRDNLDKIMCLDPSLQEYIWKQLLLFLSPNYHQFQAFYSRCPSVLQEHLSIQKADYYSQINHDVNAVSVDELIIFTNRTNDYSVLQMYLSCLDGKAANCFLEEHTYFYKMDSGFLKINLNLSRRVSSYDAILFLEKYKDEHKDDFLFHCLLAKYSLSDQKKREEVVWLQQHKSKLKISNMIDYIDALRDNECWEDIAELSKSQLPNECAFYVAVYLFESQDEKYLKTCQTIYQRLINTGWVRKGLYLNNGVVQKNLGQIEAAKNSFKEEYDRYCTDIALKSLVQLRCETHEYVIDDYFEKLKACLDAQSQYWVGATYMKCNNYSDARNHYLCSLLIDDNNNASMSGFWQVASRLPQEEVETVKENTVCILKNDQCTLQVAIHASNLISGIDTPSRVANCLHYSVEDVRIAPLLFHAPGDAVSFDGSLYTLEAILSVDEIISKFFFNSLIDQKDTIAINASSPEDLIDQITPILKSSTENIEKIISDYNQQEIRYPLTALSQITGKDMLRTCEFLAFGNKERIRNNLSSPEQSNASTTYVLSYDAIVFLVHIGIDIDKLKHLTMLCASQVKNQLKNDINGELAMLSDDNQQGSMHYVAGGIAFLERTPDERRKRHAFLTRLKAFLNGITDRNDLSTFTSSNNELDQLFLKHKFYCEEESLRVARNTPNAILVTDDQFLYAAAEFEGISNVGLTGLLTNANLNWDMLLDISKQLRYINFGNYLPLQLYKQMMDRLIQSDVDKEIASAEIQRWLVSDTDSEPSESHENIVLWLFHDVFSSKLDYLNPGNILGNIAINIFEKRNPGFIQKSVSDYLTSIGQVP